MPQDENFLDEIFQAEWSAFFEHKQSDRFWLTQRIKMVLEHEIHHLKALGMYNSKNKISKKFHVPILYNIKFNIDFNTFLIYRKNPNSSQKTFSNIFSDCITFRLSHAENRIEK